MRLFVILILLAFPASAANDIVGIPAVVDGDTLSLGNQKIRLAGIDAPEVGQMCTYKGESYDCGRSAATALITKIGWSQVRCTNAGTDKYGRVLGVCHLGLLDLNMWMVWKGHALAYREYSDAYAVFEEVAKTKQSGIWSGDFIPPWEWRKRERK